MSDVFKKLNLKDQTAIVVLDAPASFDTHLASLGDVRVLRKVPAGGSVAFGIAFATTLAAVDKVARDVAPHLDGDAILWLAYPKGTSKRYTCEFNRDTGWQSIGAKGFEPVRMVAIDEDWSALRFRRVDFIKEMKRPAEWAMTAKGKAKASGSKRR